MAGRVSVILPTYNRAGLIAETLDSLMVQTRPACQIIVIDDGSTDGTGEIVQRYSEKVTYLRKVNGGKASALNVAMNEIVGDYLWICDDDDLLEPDACERLAGKLDSDPGLGFAAGRHDDFVVDHETGEHLHKSPGYWLPSRPAEIFPDLLDGCHIFQPGMIVRNSVYEAVGGFNPALTRAQDYDMMLRIARVARGHLFSERVYLHREHSGARGSAAERFSTEQINAKWIKFHRMIFEPLMDELEDDELLAPEDWLRPEVAPVSDRVAKLRRARIYARHMMWPEALEALSEASELHVHTPLSHFERDMILGATIYNFGCAPMYEDPAYRAEVMGLKGRSAIGRSLAGLLGRSLHWRIRDAARSGKLGLAAKLTGFVAQSRI
ncbi:glycosyltransferase family 2 protein [Hyphomonas sp.]|uniref:glycosyltransferase family 2 protein n=1 Tax=Hyphomonas sp. TaxID=87 RepID=UPI0032EE97AD